MPPPVGIVRAGSTAVDGAAAATALTKATGSGVDAAKLIDNVDTVKSFRKVLETGEGLGDVSDTSKILNKVDDETFEMALNNEKVIEGLNAAKAENLVDAFKNIDDPTRLADIGKKLNTKVFDNIKNLDPALAKKLRPNLLGQGRNAATKFFRNRTTLKNLQGSVDDISKVRQGAQNPPNPENVTAITKKMEDAPTNQVDIIAKEVATNSDDVRKSLKSVNKLLKEGSESSNSLKKGLAELGITPATAAIGAGVIVLLCMAYDTDNPFTAVDRALDDTGKVVKGFKEVADSAATAAKDVTTGGFDFISFVTNNSWISFSCSILCVILLFALFMMGMLGSMGGGNNKGR